MTSTPAEPTPAPVQPSTPEPSTAVTTPDPAPAPSANVWDSPETAKAEIERLRRENGAARTNAKAQAAEEARQALAAELGKILNPEATVTDPAKLTESLTTSQAEAKQARVELAVFRNAAAAGAYPAALLDSSSFLKSLDGIDPSDAAALSEAITKAVDANPRLSAAPSEPKPPAPNPAQGASSTGPGGASQLTRADVERLAREGKHAEIDAARQAGRLNDLLGIK